MRFTFGIFLRLRRQALGLTQAQMAVGLGISQSTYSLRERLGLFYLHELPVLSRLTGCSLADLIAALEPLPEVSIEASSVPCLAAELGESYDVG